MSDGNRTSGRTLRRLLSDQRAVRRYGPVIRLPGRADRLSSWASGIACVLPAALGVWAATRAGGSPAWTPAAAGLLVSVHVTVRMTTRRGLIRRRVRLRRWGELIVLAAGALLVLSPTGAWIAGAWAGATWATAYGGTLLALAVLASRVVVGVYRTFVNLLGTRRPSTLIRVPLAGASVVANLLLRCAWAPFLMAFVMHPDARLAAPALTLAALETIMTIDQAVAETLTEQRSDLRAFHTPGSRGVDPAAEVMRYTLAVLEHRAIPPVSRLAEILDQEASALRVSAYLGEWLYDGVLSRPRRPDRTLVAMLLLDARLTAGAASTDAALRRVELAELALDLVDAEVLPRIQPRHAARLTRYLAIQRTACLWQRAEIYQYRGWEDEVLATWKECARRYAELGFPRLAAQARHTAWSRLLSRHGLDSVDLDHELLSPGDSPYVRSSAMLGLAVARQLSGDEEGARRLAADAAAVPRGGLREWFAWGREHFSGLSPYPFVLLMSGQAHRNLNKQLSSWLSRRTVPPHPAWGNPIRDLVLRADGLVQEGRAIEAAALFADAARRARAAGQLIWEMTALTGLSQLARFVGDAGLARDSLLEAMRSAEDLRGRALSPELRISAGGSISGLYDLAVWLFASSAPADPGTADGEDGGRAGPASPAVTAWHFSELARSRVFLELLGERLAPPSASGTARERDAYENYLRLRDRSSSRSAGPEEALALRKAREEWHRACEELAAVDGASAEYATLRLGRPIDYEELRRLLTPSHRPYA
ncbi:hypothetical protein [Microbispora triticiradicis]|uniref:hypothetical protein n=1 Tax=Microbispora triticiradicis TaxID=2200763 RepID=UPI000E3DBD95|nr:hypothetical protein [Microbispora triticiradicis]